MRRIVILLALAVFVAGGLVGCGNSNKSTQPQGEVPLQGDPKANGQGKDKDKKNKNQPGGSGVVD